MKRCFSSVILHPSAFILGLFHSHLRVHGHSRRQKLSVTQVRIVDRNLHRNALHDFDEVSGGVFSREEVESRAGVVAGGAGESSPRVGASASGAVRAVAANATVAAAAAAQTTHSPRRMGRECKGGCGEIQFEG